MEKQGKPVLSPLGADLTPLPQAEVKRPSLRTVVSSRLREAIISGELHDGDRLNEVDIAQWLGVSRGLVREAMRVLENSGLVENIPYRGTFVAGLTPERVNELYTLRSVLEEYAVDLAINRITDEDIRDLSGLIDKMRQAAIHGEAMQLVEFDMEFHKRVYTLSHHHLLIDTLKRLSGQIQWFIVATKVVYSLFPTLDAIAETHEPILEALRQRNHSEARQAVHDHICEVGDRLVRILKGEDQKEVDIPPGRAF